MTSRFFKFIVLALLITTTGLGCKGLSAEQQAAIRPVTLTYWTVFNDVEELQALAAQYQQARPHVTVAIRQIRYDEFDDIFTNALADDAGPDIVSIHTHWLHKYEQRLSPMPRSIQVARLQPKGGLSNETEVVVEQRAMPTLADVERNYISTVADDIVVNNQMYGLPIVVDTMALFYNKTLLDRTGIATPPATWESFQEAVRAGTIYATNGDIAQSGVALGRGDNIENAADIFALLLRQNGLSVIQNGVVAFTRGIDQNAQAHPALESLRFYTDYARNDRDVYSWNDEKRSAFEDFIRGRSLFYFGYGFDVSRISSQNPQLSFDVVPLPQLRPERPVNIANYWIESVVKKSSHQDEAWDFIRFITSPTVVERYSAATNQPSPLRSQIENQKADPSLAPFSTYILTAENWYTGKDITTAKAAFTRLFDQQLQPYSDRVDPVERDANLLINTARIIQQTL